jgi:glycogen(starch) synthase
VVAFIDDDAVPEPTWLEDLVAGYDDDEVASVGGVVRNHTGYDFQCQYVAVNRFGSPWTTSQVPLSDMSFPGTFNFPVVLGANSSFRRDRLVEVGGFDEEYEFFHDEADVCARLVDHGWVVRQLPGAEIHHKYLPSAIRDSSKVTVNLFPVMKNKVYFSMLHGLPDHPMGKVMEDNGHFATELRAGLETAAADSLISDDDLQKGLESIDRGWTAGLSVGARGRRRMLDPVAASDPPAFRRFATVAPAGRRLRVAMVSQGYPPADTGGIARYVHDVARDLARRGHEVRVLTTGAGHCTVDLEEGVWVHRLVKGEEQDPSEEFADVPDAIWRNAAAVADEVERLQELRPLDAVLGAVWDVETLAVLERTDLPVVTTLVTSVGIMQDSRPGWVDDPAVRAEFVEPMLVLERALVERSALVHAISGTILTEGLAAAGATVDPERVVVAHLGSRDHAADGAGADDGDDDGAVRVLFVGRWEHRKGIDLLLDAVPSVLAARDDVRFVLLGRHDLPGPDGATYLEAFERQWADAPWRDRVECPGPVDDERLWDEYRRCDVFVAPSRFESFGLVFVEAMMAGKPVVALRQGAAVEVVDDGTTGLLVDPDSTSVADAVVRLASDASLRRSMGAAGRERFEAEFTDRAMGARFESFLQELVARPREGAPR